MTQAPRGSLEAMSEIGQAKQIIFQIGVKQKSDRSFA